MTKSNRKYKLYAALGFVVLFALLMLFLFSGENAVLLKHLFDTDQTREELQEKLAGFGIRGYVTIAILSMLQVVISFLPAEPVQVIGGIAFGFPIGLACCTVGVFFGNTVIYVLYKIFGDKLRAFFDKNLHVDLEKAGASGKITLLVFILYFLPAIPYGMICFFAATMRMKYPRYICITLLGAIPSICIGVGLGHMAIASSWILSVTVFAVLLLLLGIMMWKKEALFAKVNAFFDKEPYSSKTTVRVYGHGILDFLYVWSRIIFFFKGVKVKYTNHVKDIETPCIVLCNHGSFIDFAYAGTLLRKKSPNFIVARLYFYKKWLGNLLRRVGCFPKSMFALDLESTKNCLRVLKNGGVLAMMPEARLSTVGRFEDIQEETYGFLKAAGVPIYTVSIRGDYFAKPKWGGKLRRGALVEAELNPLFTAEEVKALSKEEIKDRTEAALCYDDFRWLETHPEIQYRSRKLAEGLENILSKCPACHQKYTLKAKKRTIVCENCGHTATLNARYAFADGKPFENFAAWYDWQCEEQRQEIAQSPDFALTSRVVLKHASTDGKTMLRVAGEGLCSLSREGLTYVGTRDGEQIQKHFPLKSIYRLLFGAGEDFEIYEGKEIYYFIPEEPKSAVDWYIVSRLLKDDPSLHHQPGKEQNAYERSDTPKAAIQD